MDIDEPIPLWVPLLVSTVFIVLLSMVPLPLLFFLIVLALMSFGMFQQVLYTRKLAKSFWLSTYLRPDSPIREMLNGSFLLNWIAIAIAIPLSAVTYITVYGYDFYDCIAVAVGIFLAKLVHQTISSPIDNNLAEHLVELASMRVYYWLAIVFVLLSLATSSVVKSAFSDYSKATSQDISKQTIESIKHPVKIVQHCVRTLRYSELQLLRVRDTNGWPYGWLIYFFFLVPNALPAFGLVTLYSGAERLANKWRDYEKVV